MVVYSTYWQRIPIKDISENYFDMIKRLRKLTVDEEQRLRTEYPGHCFSTYCLSMLCVRCV